MLRSKHIFIQQGALKANDNGRKKFCHTSLRRIDRDCLLQLKRINQRINFIEDGMKIVLFGEEEEREYIKKYTNVRFKIVVEEYPLEKLGQVDVKNKVVFVADEKNKEVSGNIIYLYEQYEMPFYKRLSKHSGEICWQYVDAYGTEILESYCKIEDLIRNVIKNKKVLLYGAGGRLGFMLSFFDWTTTEIVAVVDRDAASAQWCEAELPEDEVLNRAEVIIVTPFYAGNAIKDFLINKKVKAEIVCVADIEPIYDTTRHYNRWAPDEPVMLENGTDVEAFKTWLYDLKDNSKEYVMCKHYKKGIVRKRSTEYLEFEKQIGIVLQGPVVYDQDFTWETIQLYKNNYPQATIILSVWENEKQNSEFEKFREAGIEIVYAQKPKIRGYQNTNLQLATSAAGIQRAKEMGLKYVAKTRTDMRFYDTDMYLLMKSLYKLCPNDLGENDIQKERLVIFPPRWDYFYFICDFFMFGDVDDMMLYWNVDDLIEDRYQGEAAETILGNRFAGYLGKRLDNKLENAEEYYRIIKKHFLVIEDKQLQYVWYKYFFAKAWGGEYHNNIVNYTDWLE